MDCTISLENVRLAQVRQMDADRVELSTLALQVPCYSLVKLRAHKEPEERIELSTTHLQGGCSAMLSYSGICRPDWTRTSGLFFVREML